MGFQGAPSPEQTCRPPCSRPGLRGRLGCAVPRPCWPVPPPLDLSPPALGFSAHQGLSSPLTPHPSAGAPVTLLAAPLPVGHRGWRDGGLPVLRLAQGVHLSCTASSHAPSTRGCPHLWGPGFLSPDSGWSACFLLSPPQSARRARARGGSDLSLLVAGAQRLLVDRGVADGCAWHRLGPPEHGGVLAAPEPRSPSPCLSLPLLPRDSAAGGRWFLLSWAFHAVADELMCVGLGGGQLWFPRRAGSWPAFCFCVTWPGVRLFFPRRRLQYCPLRACPAPTLS